MNSENEKIEKLIFLDVDGVLNFGDCWSPPDGLCVLKGNRSTHVLSPDCIKRLNRITNETGAKIVLSSTWRLYKDHYDFLLSSGITGEIIGETPDLLYDTSRDTCRGHEIQEWLDEYDKECKFIILDDNSDMGELMPYLILTDFEIGLTDEFTELAIEKLNN